MLYDKDGNFAKGVRKLEAHCLDQRACASVLHYDKWFTSKMKVFRVILYYLTNIYSHIGYQSFNAGVLVNLQLV